MKNIITLVLLTFTVSLFGQMKEYKKATNLYNDKKFSEANIILEKLINKEYGELEQEMAFYVLYMNAGCYYNLNDFKIANTKYEELIVFVKNSVNLFKTPSGKEETITSLEKFKEDFKSKIPKDENTSIQNNISSESNTITNSVSNENITKANSDNKTVTLTVSGTGKTIEEAKLNAFHSAIKQAFETFISSKTEILNDIISTSNVNIEKYNIISQTEIPNNGFAIIISAIISIDKLTSFAESKGVEVEFNGGMFANKIKLQKLNEKNELMAATQILGVVHEALQNSFDYKIDVSESPKFVNDNLYNLPISVSVLTNPYYENTIKYLLESLKGLSMDSSEYENYINLNKKIFTLDISYGDTNAIIYLRNQYSFQTITNIFKSWDFYLGNYLVSNNINTIEGPDLFTTIPDNLYTKQGMVNEPFVLKKDNGSYYNGEIINYEAISYKSSDKYEKRYFIFPKQKSQIRNYKWNQVYTLNEIERLTKFEVKSKGIVSPFINGGYLLYETSDTKVIVSPCTIVSIAEDDISCNVDYIKENINQPSNDSLGSSYNNTSLLGIGNDKNTLGNALLEFNTKQNTSWAIPSSKELILMNIKLAKIGLFDFSPGNNYEYNTMGNVYMSSTRNMKSGYIVLKCIKYGDINKSYSTNFINKLKIPLIDYINNNTDININTNNMSNAIWTKQKSREKYIIQPVKYFKKGTTEKINNENKLINNSESKPTEFKVECIEKRVKSSTSEPKLIKSCILNNFKSVSTGEADYKGRYSYKYEIFIKKNGEFVKSNNENLFNEKKEELLKLINQKIKIDFDDYATNPETKDCFEGVTFTNYTYENLGIVFTDDKVDFNVWFDVFESCFNVSSTTVSFSLEEIRPYFNSKY